MTDATLPPTSRPGNTRIAAILALVALFMVGMAFAAVPLYDLFCRVTGYNGTTQVADANPKGTIARQMTVAFDSNVESSLAWRVQPSRPVTDSIGAVTTIVYTATNLSNREVTGSAIFNVVPETTGVYFNKIECFCFTEQTLAPGETVEMPVTFFVDPDLAENRDLDSVRQITLSYTFYASSEGT